MSKVCLNINLSVMVDTDLTSVADIVDNLEIEVSPLTENVEIADSEIVSFFMDSKE